MKMFNGLKQEIYEAFAKKKELSDMDLEYLFPDKKSGHLRGIRLFLERKGYITRGGKKTQEVKETGNIGNYTVFKFNEGGVLKPAAIGRKGKPKVASFDSPPVKPVITKIGHQTTSSGRYVEERLIAVERQIDMLKEGLAAILSRL